jgi:hypothetical protein
MKTVVHIPKYIFWVFVYFGIIFLFLQLSKCISKFLFDNLIIQTIFKFGLYFGLIYLLYKYVFYGVYKTIKYKKQNTPVLIMKIIKPPFIFKTEITISENYLTLITKEGGKKLYLNFFYLEFKLRKLLKNITDDDFFKILMIIKEDHLLRKHFPDELRMEKIKTIIDEE